MSMNLMPDAEQHFRKALRVAIILLLNLNQVFEIILKSLSYQNS